MSNEYNRPFYEIICSLNHYKLGTIIESETGQRYKLTKTDNEYRKFSRIDKGLRFLTYENMNKKFRIVEEQKEINIQRINEITYKNEKIGYGSIEKYTDDIDDYCTAINSLLDGYGITINELVQAVKQLDKKLKEK